VTERVRPQIVVVGSIDLDTARALAIRLDRHGAEVMLEHDVSDRMAGLVIRDECAIVVHCGSPLARHLAPHARRTVDEADDPIE